MGGGKVVIVLRTYECFAQIASRYSGFTKCPCVPYCPPSSTVTDYLLSSPGAELYLLEDDMFITFERGLTGFVSFFPCPPNR